MFAYLFAKELSRRQIPCTILGITATSTNGLTANHSIVQVETDQGKYTFDPTYGNYYAADIETLCESGNAESFKVGEATEDVYYQTNRFFEQVQIIYAYSDIRNYYDLDLGKNFSQQTQACLPISPRLSTVQYNGELAPDTIKTTFQQEVSFYRVRMEFVDPVPEDAAFTCTVTRADGTVEEVEGFVQQDSYQVNFQAFEQTDALEVEMRIACAQTLPELIQYTIYQ